MSVPLAPKFAVVVALAASAGFYLRRDALLLAPACARRLALDAEGGVTLTRRDGASASGTLLSGNVVTPRFAVLAYRLDGERRVRRIPIVADMLGAEEFRLLRVHLKWRVLPAAAKPAR